MAARGVPPLTFIQLAAAAVDPVGMHHEQFCRVLFG